MLDTKPELLKQILRTDEAKLKLSGRVTKQNYRFWKTQNPQVIQKIALFCIVLIIIKN